MMKKGLIVVFVVAILAIMSWLVYPRYRLYRFLQEYKDVDSFHDGICRIAVQDFIDYFFRFYHYPESSEDSAFRCFLYEVFEGLPDIYTYGVFIREDTTTINDSIDYVTKLYLKGPNHNEKHTGQIINPIDYKKQIITPVDMPFHKFLFSKGDILVGLIPEHNPCDYSYSQNFAYKEKPDVHDSIVRYTFNRAIFYPYREKYGASPIYIRDFHDDAAVICYEANLYSDTLVLSQKCEPFNGEYDTSSMTKLLNKPLYIWAKETGLHQFYFSIAVRPSFFEKIDK